MLGLAKGSPHPATKPLGRVLYETQHVAAKMLGLAKGSTQPTLHK